VMSNEILPVNCNILNMGRTVINLRNCLVRRATYSFELFMKDVIIGSMGPHATKVTLNGLTFGNRCTFLLYVFATYI